MDPYWHELMAKHSKGIDPDIATQEELEEYVATKIHDYTQTDLIDYSLWTVFQEDFKSFTTEHFKILRTPIRAKLRTHCSDEEYMLPNITTDTHSQKYCLTFSQRRNPTNGQMKNLDWLL